MISLEEQEPAYAPGARTRELQIYIFALQFNSLSASIPTVFGPIIIILLNQFFSRYFRSPMSRHCLSRIPVQFPALRHLLDREHLQAVALKARIGFLTNFALIEMSTSNIFECRQRLSIYFKVEYTTYEQAATVVVYGMNCFLLMPISIAFKSISCVEIWKCRGTPKPVDFLLHQVRPVDIHSSLLRHHVDTNQMIPA